MTRLFLTSLFVLCSGIVGFTQTPNQQGPMPKTQDRLCYLDTEGRDWVFLEANPDNPILARIIGRTRQIPSPVRFGTVLDICPSESGLWACVIEEPPSGARMVVLRWDHTAPEKGWERMGEVEDSHGVPYMMIPLHKKDQFLGLAYERGFVGDRSGASLAARFQLRGGKFEFQDLVDMAVDGVGNIARWVPASVPSATPQSEGKQEGSLRPWQVASCVIDLPALTPSLRPASVSRDHLAVCATQAGVIWLFELDKGTLRRTFNLDELTINEFKKAGLLNHTILGAAFNPGGQLVVAKRDRELSRIAVKLARETTEPVEAKRQREDLQMFTDLYKDIRWLALDPETGARQDLDSPADFPTATPSFSKQTYLRFLITPLGIVKTNAYRDWESLKQEFGIHLDAPATLNPEGIKKSNSKPEKKPQPPRKKD